jgi:hypothetical protein
MTRLDQVSLLGVRLTIQVQVLEHLDTSKNLALLAGS